MVDKVYQAGQDQLIVSKQPLQHCTSNLLGAYANNHWACGNGR